MCSKEIPQNQPYFVVRSRYDKVRRIPRPFLNHPAPSTSSNDIVIDAQTHRSTTETCMSDIEKAVQSMQLSSAPNVLPCRDQERAQIERILVSQLRVGGGAGGALYISGLPGTGKTATVRRVIRGLQQSSELPSFDYVEINALKLQAPRYAYVVLWKAISKQHCSPARALSELNRYYGSLLRRRRKQVIILVLDEFDYLVEAKSHKVGLLYAFVAF
jgi:origin recognition complex subunit 1